jgi:hypothetical protein
MMLKTFKTTVDLLVVISVWCIAVMFTVMAALILHSMLSYGLGVCRIHS